MPGQPPAGGWPQIARFGLAAAWGLLGAAACACVFVISTIPIGPDGRTVPALLLLLDWTLDACMLPFCSVAPILLLRAGYTYLRHSAGPGILWTLVWGAVASASLAVEALFLIRIVHWLRTPYRPNLGYMAWHALDFAAGFLVVGTAMTCMLIGAQRRKTRRMAGQ